MFGRSRPVVFDPGRSRRARAGVPRWLVLSLLGALAGAAGVLYVQHAWLPPRLSSAETAALRQAFEQADAQRKRLGAELAQAREGLRQAQAVVQRLGADAARADEQVSALRADLAVAVDALPPDPRDGPVAVRSARFTARKGRLDYDVVLSRDAPAAAEPVRGVLQFVVAGDSAGQGESSLRLQPLALTLGAHEVASGSLPLPPGFKPRQATVRVLDRPEGRQLGMRVLLVD
jgi:hypothetical protein